MHPHPNHTRKMPTNNQLSIISEHTYQRRDVSNYQAFDICAFFLCISFYPLKFQSLLLEEESSELNSIKRMPPRFIISVLDHVLAPHLYSIGTFGNLVCTLYRVFNDMIRNIWWRMVHTDMAYHACHLFFLLNESLHFKHGACFCG